MGNHQDPDSCLKAEHNITAQGLVDNNLAHVKVFFKMSTCLASSEMQHNNNLQFLSSVDWLKQTTTISKVIFKKKNWCIAVEWLSTCTLSLKVHTAED